MKFYIFLFCALLAGCLAAVAQVEMTSKDYFPAELEFRELQKVVSEESFENHAQLEKMEDGRLILDEGFESYRNRAYSTAESGKLVIEVIALRDFRAAYSLLTLSSNSSIQNGPPGDAYTLAAGSLRFFQGKYLVRLRGEGVSEDLLKRIALSVSNRIGPRDQNPPALISHFPKSGFDASSLKYFPGLKPFEFYLGSAAVRSLDLRLDVEIAQARYTVGNQHGVLYLLNFPTGQVAEEYFDEFGSGMPPDTDGYNTYAKRAGPIIGILKGPIDPVSADKLLSSLRYSYSIRWIYEKQNKSKILWGVPVSILGTVVKSFFFIAILAVVSIIAGAGFAVLRFALRGHFSKNAPDQPEQSEIIRLRLQ